MAGTTVIYAGVKLYNCKTLQWDQEIVYDDSKTDTLFVRFKLKFQCLLHSQAAQNWSTNYPPPIFISQENSSQPLDQAGTDTCMSLRELTRRLKTPRCDLAVTMGGRSMLAISPYSTTSQAPSAGADSGRAADTESVWTDVENGPKPQNVHVTQLATGGVSGAALFTLDFEIHAACVLCSGGKINFVINNRWSIAESMDANFFTTRSITGKMRVASALLNHEMARAIVLPGLEDGFRRDSIDYSVEADGLTVNYVVKDRQIYQSAPWPCTRMEGSHTESTADGLTWKSSVEVEVEGHPGASKAAMLGWIIKIMESRLGDLTTVNSTSKQKNNALRFVENCVFTDHIGERNVMSGQLTLTHTVEAEEGTTDVYLKNLNLDVGKFGSPLTLEKLDDTYKGYDSVKSHVPAMWGYDVQGGDEGRDATTPKAVRLLLSCYLQSPCLDAHNVGNANSPSYYTSNLTPNNNQSKPPAISEHKDKTSLPGTPDPKTSLSSAQGQAIYTVSRMETHYRRTPLRAQLPIAAVGLKPNADTCVVVRLGSDIGQVDFHYEAERYGEQPAIPEPKDWYLPSGLKAYLLDHYIRLHPPTVSNNATGKFFRTEAFYIYALNRPPLPTETIPVGVLPALSYTAKDNSVRFQDLYDAKQAFDAGGGR